MGDINSAHLFVDVNSITYDDTTQDDDSSEDEGEFEAKSIEIDDESKATQNHVTDDSEDNEDGEDSTTNIHETMATYDDSEWIGFFNFQTEDEGSMENTPLRQPNGKQDFGIVIYYDSSMTKDIKLKTLAIPLLAVLHNMSTSSGVFANFSSLNVDSPICKKKDTDFISRFIELRDKKIVVMPPGVTRIYCGSLKETKSGWESHGLGLMYFQDEAILLSNWKLGNSTTPSIYFAPASVGTVSKSVSIKVPSFPEVDISKALQTKKSKSNNGKAGTTALLLSKKQNDDITFTVEYDDGCIVYAGYTKEFVRHGFGACVMPDGSSLIGRWSQGQFSGPNNVWCYDGLKPWDGALCGAFRKGKMASAAYRKYDSVSKILICDGVKVPGETTTGYESYLDEHNESFVYAYDPSKKARISAFPCQPDPWESYRVVSRPSSLPNSGDGLYARREIAPCELISFYNGTRPSTKEVDDRSWELNSNAITVVDDESTCIDVPAPYDALSHYCASLSHKANHCFDWEKVNAIFELLWHPRFGKIKAMRAIRTILPGEEIFVDYGYELSTEAEMKEHNATSATYTQEEELAAIDSLDGPDWWKDCLKTVLPLPGREGRKKSADEAACREELKDTLRKDYVCQSVEQIPSDILPLQLECELREQGIY